MDSHVVVKSWMVGVEPGYLIYYCNIFHYASILQVIDYFSPSTYNYLLGKSILVAPIVSNDTTAFKVDLPKGDSWVYWWNHSIISAGGSSFHFNGSVPLDEFPVFFVNGKSLEHISCAARSNVMHDLLCRKLYPVACW